MSLVQPFDLFLNPLNHSDLRPAVQTKWKKGPTYSSVDVQSVSAGFVPAGHATVTSGWKPEDWYSRHPPLPAMAVSAEDQVNGMMRLDIIEDVGRMCQQESEPSIGARRDTTKIRTMKRRIIDADNHEFSIFCRDDGTLVHQQCDLVPIGKFRKLCHRHSAIMVVIAQGHVQGRDGT
jgi:hypothetical protein